MIAKFLIFSLCLLGSFGVASANRVSLNDIFLYASTKNEGKYKVINLRICFRSNHVDNIKQKRNCLRLKSAMTGMKQYESVILETSHSQFNFTTNKRYGQNVQFWLQEQAKDDTLNFYSLLKQLNKSENALIGAMCKKIGDKNWLQATFKKAMQSSNRVDQQIKNRFNVKGFRDFDQILNRCEATVEQKIGKIELVKAAVSKTVRTRRECEYSKVKLYNMQSILSELDLYKAKIDGRYGPGTKKAVKIAKNYIFQFANRSSDCLSANELSWLKLLVSVKRKGQECKNFNSSEELKEIAKLLELIGRPVFSPFSAVEKVRYSDYDYRQVVYAIIDYENSLDDDYFNVAQRSRDCRIIPLEKVGLVSTSENKLFNEKKEEEVAKKKAQEEAEKKVEELAKLKAEEEKRKAEELAKRKAEEEAEKKAEELAKQKAEGEKRKAEELARRKAEEEARKKEKELAKKKARKELLRQKAEVALQKKISSYQEESQLIVSDIKTFMKSPNDFDLVKIAKLVAGFNDKATIGWNEETVLLYEKLKKYVLSFDDFVEFRKEQIDFRVQEKNKNIETLIAQIDLNTQAIKKYVAANIGSNDLGEAIQLLEEIEDKNNRDLKELTQLFTEIRNFTIIYDIDVEEIPTPLAEPDKVENQELEKPEEPKIKKKVERVFKAECFNAYAQPWGKTKEVGDGFNNFEASKDRLLIPFILNKLNQIKCDHGNIKDDEEIKFSFVMDNTKLYKANEEASEAFAAQQDITNSFQETKTYTVKAKNLALVFEISKRDLKNANCGSFIVVFDDYSYRAFRSDAVKYCEDIKPKE